MAGEWAIVAAAGVGVAGTAVPATFAFLQDRGRRKQAEREVAATRREYQRVLLQEVINCAVALSNGAWHQTNLTNLDLALTRVVVECDDPPASLARAWLADRHVARENESRPFHEWYPAFLDAVAAAHS